MIDKQMLYSLVDELPPDDLEQLYQHIKQRRQVMAIHTATGNFRAVVETTQPKPAETIRDEVNTLVDEAIAQVRRKHDTQERTQAQK